MISGADYEQPKTVRRQMVRRSPIITPSYTLTPLGYKRFLSRRDELEKLRADTVEQMRAASRQQSSDPFEATADMQLLYQIDGELTRIDTILENTVLCSPAAKKSTVEVGAKVTLRDQHKQLEVMVVDSVEADPTSGSISTSSPLGRSLLGTHPHDRVTVDTPGGQRIYEVLAVS